MANAIRRKILTVPLSIEHMVSNSTWMQFFNCANDGSIVYAMYMANGDVTSQRLGNLIVPHGLSCTVTDTVVDGTTSVATVIVTNVKFANVVVIRFFSAPFFFLGFPRPIQYWLYAPHFVFEFFHGQGNIFRVVVGFRELSHGRNELNASVDPPSGKARLERS
jgi:hypothetical protein